MKKLDRDLIKTKCKTDDYSKIKKLNSNVEFSSDFIIGYPGETENDFLDTLELLEKIRFVNSYWICQKYRIYYIL